MSEKPKRGNSNKPAIRKFAFFFLWMLLPLAVSFLSQPVFDWTIRLIEQAWGVIYLSGQYRSWRAEFLGSMVIAILTIPAEKILLRLGFGKWLRGWISGGLFSAALLSLLSIYIEQNNLQSLYTSQPQGTLLFFLMATIYILPRAWALRRYVKQSWAYFLAMVVGLFIHGRVIDFQSDLGLSISPLTLLIVPTIVGLVLLWLFRDTPTTEKAKVDEASARLEDKIADEIEAEETEESERRSSLREAIYAFYEWVLTALHNPILEKNRRAMYD